MTGPAVPTPQRAGLRRLHTDQSGNGPMTSVGGVLMFLLFLLVTVQASIHLFALSRATALTVDAATRIARQEATCADAEAFLRTRLGEWGDDVEVTCSGDDVASEQVVVGVRGPSPAPALRGLGAIVGLDTVVREARVRNEVFR